MNVETAERIARDAHAGVDDRLGVPYIRHVERVAAAAPDDEDAKVVAWLHDVLEDTDVTVQDLLDQGITQVQLIALNLVTRDPSDGLTYMQWIRKIADAPGEPGRIARADKYADGMDNLNRPKAPGMEGIERRYQRSTRILREAMIARGELVPAGR